MHFGREVVITGKPEAGLEIVKSAGSRSITLVKDTRHQLPISSGAHQRAYVIVLSNPPIFRGNAEDPMKKRIREKMEAFGYDVTMHESFYDLASKQESGEDILQKSILIGSAEEFKRNYDVVFTFIHIDGFGHKLYYHHRRGFEDCFEAPQNIPFRSCL